MELISSSFRLDFREFCVGLTLRHINDAFQMAGIQPHEIADAQVSGTRRIRVMEYYASIDWTSRQDIHKFLRAIDLLLSQAYITESDKSILRKLCDKEGLIVNDFNLRINENSSSRIKNIIFAADGPKPEIVLTDSTTNDIRIIKNEQYCLVYNRDIPRHGLLWQELIEWWGERNSLLDLGRAEIDLHERLRRSLTDSEPERRMFDLYFIQFRSLFKERLPALIPQVYLHYDPYTMRQLGGTKRLPRQRMDFLMLLANGNKVVIEIDGRHHYALKNGQASPHLYAEMVVEDRRLKLAGYDVYHFGGYEFSQTKKAPEIINGFFRALFERYSITD